MDKKREPFEYDVPKHKKKSKKKGLPRADHKHVYKDVLIHSWVKDPFGRNITREHIEVCEVCTICGRIGDYLSGMFYDWEKNPKGYDASQMEHWKKNDWMDKFAEKYDKN